jgi:hypothetical protein
MQIPVGQILLGTRITDIGYWTAPTCIPEDLDNIHGHTFAVDATSEEEDVRLFPVDFREGPAPSMGNVDCRLFVEFNAYLQAKGLGNIFGLQIAQGEARRMVEFSYEIGNLLVEEGKVKAEMIGGGKEVKLQETAWTATVKDGIISQAVEIRCVVIAGVHREVEVPVNELDIVKILEDEGVLDRSA